MSGARAIDDAFTAFTAFTVYVPFIAFPRLVAFTFFIVGSSSAMT